MSFILVLEENLNSFDIAVDAGGNFRFTTEAEARSFSAYASTTTFGKGPLIKLVGVTWINFIPQNANRKAFIGELV